MKPDQPKFSAAAYGGENWSPRKASHRDEIGSLWGQCGVNTEWNRLQGVLLHPPGTELAALGDPESAQLLEIPDWKLARQQHDSLAQAYRDQGVSWPSRSEAEAAETRRSIHGGAFLRDT